MKRRSLTYVGAFLFALAIFLAWSEMKQPKTKQQPLAQASEVSKPKPRLVTTKKTEAKPQPVVEEFTIKTRVSMANPNQQ